ncbi:L-histidine N(alpha)-methyltransferase [Streptomyces sp. NRRL S-455]|uniref:L-histidine N(alpha)-methyltransferase n=1 Tax=Streptomyces sp. NRRL S-455 TaxID=1463908 RepID=UPI0004C290FA|nr:L-histidine N(alpha)-methyltransferase [Streptomyces sp. NRRL S-455]
MGAPGDEESVYRDEVIGWLRRGVLPVRYMYAGSGADRHIRFAEEYADEYRDGRLDDETAAAVGGLGPAGVPAQMCDIGPSNGLHTAQFLDWFAGAHAGRARYLGMDFSRRLLAAARRRTRRYASVERSFAWWDVEAAATPVVRAWRSPGPVLFCLLGNTLGNVENPAHVLRNIFGSARPDDILMLGLFGPPGQGEDDADDYRSPAIRDMILEPLSAVGIPVEGLVLRLTTVDDSVVGTVRLHEPVTLAGTRLPARHEVRCFLSRRYHPAGARHLLRRTGWLPLETHADPGHGHFVLLARRMPTAPDTSGSSGPNR